MTSTEATTSTTLGRPPRPTRGGGPAARAPEPVRSTGQRRARLALRRVDPWSVFVFALAFTFFLGIALVVAVYALYSVLDNAGVVSSVNELIRTVTGEETTDVLTQDRALLVGLVTAALEVVLVTLLATLGALLYNLCASFTGGIEVTLGEREG